MENFARKLRADFHQEMERDAAQFKRRAFALLSTALASKRGRPRAGEVTRAASMREQGKEWREIYAACLPSAAASEARQLAQMRLRNAVRARCRRYQPRTKSSAIS